MYIEHAGARKMGCELDQRYTYSKKGFADPPPRILDVVDNFRTLKGKLSQNPTIWPLKGKLSQNPVIQVLACLKNIF
jgi:hypothetical protein